MRKLLLIFGMLWAVTSGFAQIIIQGKVLDNSTGLPVSNAGVYLNNTTYGTNTDSEGKFFLGVSNIFTGDLIVSSSGFEPLSYKLRINDAGKKLFVFKLEVREKKVNGILDLDDAGRQRWLNIFKANFLGVTEEAENCKIENPGALYFNADSSGIYAYADTPLIITNNLLGYKIAVDLVEFYFDLNKMSASFFGFTRYGQMDEDKKCLRRRKLNYYGSTMHFLRALVNRELETEGFSMFEVKKPVEQKDPLKNIVEKLLAARKAVPAIPIKPVNILFIDDVSNEYYLQFSNRIMVQFVKNPRRKNNYITDDINARDNSDFGFTAYIDLLADKVELDAKGFTRNPLAIACSGFWNYEKLANQLPFDYTPE